MKSTETTVEGQNFLAFKDANISKVEGLEKLLASFAKRISVSYSSCSTVNTYRRSVRDIGLFHGC
ncbi:MAG: hypothetical protein M3421_07840, partial [Bacteroidota bacterium]|nr:hypothetical protein [Bacteroidota bacterium]